MTQRRVVTTARADHDVDHVIDYYRDSSSEAADRFIDALQAGLTLLADHPSIGATRFAIDAGIPELRGLTLQHFPYVLLYTDDDDSVRMHRVLHTSRDLPNTD